MSDQDILDGVGNEVVYFFVLLVLLLVVVIAWYSTYVVEPVVQSVILVERSPVAGAGAADTQEINSSTVEEVRQAVTQFLQQQQLDTDSERGDETTEQQQPDQIIAAEEVVAVAAEPVTVPEEERVTVRLKFLNDTQRDVSASLVENIGQFKRRNFSEEISDNKNVKLIFNGQVLRDESVSLRSCGIFDKCVVHCLIHQGPAQPLAPPPGPGPHHHHHHAHNSNSNNTQHRDLDLSAYFIPILGIALACLWYFAVAYTAYFNFLSTSALVGLTSLYFLSVYGTHFHVNVAVRT